MAKKKHDNTVRLEIEDGATRTAWKEYAIGSGPRLPIWKEVAPN